MSDRFRNGNMSVKRMIDEIQNEILMFDLTCASTRCKRQVEDSKRFIVMINQPTYSKCQKISELKKEICKKRDKLKQDLVDLEEYKIGYQFALFEDIHEISNEALMEITSRREKIEEEIHWLHKCLGICCSRDYFK